MSDPIRFLDIAPTKLSGMYKEASAQSAPAGSVRYLRDYVFSERYGLFDSVTGRLPIIAGGTLLIGLGPVDEPPTSGTHFLKVSTLTSGVLVSGKRYLIETYVAGDSFTNVGAANNASNVRFTASGTTPTTWTNGSTVREITTDLQNAITDTALAAALNATAKVTADGGVAVALTGDAPGLYEVTWTLNGARDLLEGDASDLVPPSFHLIKTRDEGTASAREKQVVEWFQQPYASGEFVPSAAGTAVLAALEAGSEGVRAKYSIAFTENIVGGVLALAWSSPQKTQVRFYDGNEGTPETRFIKVVGAAVALDGLHFDIYLPDESYLRVWFDLDNGSTPPAVGAGGTLVEVDITTGWTTTQIATALHTALNGAAGIAVAATALNNDASSSIDVAYRAADAIYYTLDDPGTVREIDLEGLEFTSAVFGGAGSDGSHAGKWFKLEDANEDIVGVYFTAGRTDGIPATLEDYDRLLPVALDLSDADTVCATKLAAAVAADAHFAAAATSSSVLITDSFGGSRSGPTVASAVSFTVSVQRAGIGIAADLEYGWTEEQLEAALGDAFAVVKKDGKWLLTSAVPGEQEEPEIDPAELIDQRYFEGQINFNTVALQYAFRVAGTDLLDGVRHEMKFSPASGDPRCIYIGSAELHANLLRIGGFSPISFGAALTAATGLSVLYAVNGYTTGGATNLDGIVTAGLSVPRLYAFVHATDGYRVYRLRSGTDAESSPAIIRPDDYSASNQKVWESVN